MTQQTNSAPIPVGRIRLEGVRLSFADIFVARPFKPGDDPKFKATFLIPKGSALEKAVWEKIRRVASDSPKWKGANVDAVLKSIQHNPNKFCFQDGDSKTYEGYAGMMALTARNDVRPTVIDRNRAPLVAADGKVYAGCYVNASIELFAYDNTGKGISATLRGVQFDKDGEAFTGGGTASEDEFDDISTGADADAEFA